MNDLDVRYFDGCSSKPHAARLCVQDDALTVAPMPGETFPPLTVSLAQVRWPERTRHGGRIARLPQGASVQALDTSAWDAWVAQLGRGESWVVRAQQSWRGVAVAFVLLVGAIAAMYQWGLPWVAGGVTAMVPQRVDALIGEQVLESLDQSLLQPGALAPAEQERIRKSFTRMVQTAHAVDAPAWRLEFRRSREQGRQLGPNALALPGGTIVLTDELVALMPGNDDAVLGVLAHEFGHVRKRHAMRQLVQVSAIGFAASVAVGDYGTLISSAPVVLASLGYSRDAEREADAESLRLMRAAGIPPRAMVAFFEAIEHWRDTAQRGTRSGDDAIGLAFSSHPATTERIAYFRDAPED
ncbi:M48 family metallopeptidase [Variovorax sp. J22P240]|uniref:M48 family metallopeptidase n=1 Tax=Variovorax sp. J22P240 TaxID=3053514 RepID=UPI002578F01E|nr:M48 family metallopeptidase [Variovorax sp. J22P240]MDL9999064.1 M48 family metallopeptidase [Variovorax sp. J22P240]